MSESGQSFINDVSTSLLDTSRMLFVQVVLCKALGDTVHIDCDLTQPQHKCALELCSVQITAAL